MTDTAGLRNYPFEPFTGDVPGELIDMVESNPVSKVLLPDGRPCWLVLSYEHCRRVITDPHFARLHVGRPDGGPRDLNMDGPAHTAVRRVAMRPFTARRIESYRPMVQRLVDELVDDMIAGPPPADLVSALVAPLPALRDLRGSRHPGDRPTAALELDRDPQLDERIRLGQR